MSAFLIKKLQAADSYKLSSWLISSDLAVTPEQHWKLEQQIQK